MRSTLQFWVLLSISISMTMSFGDDCAEGDHFIILPDQVTLHNVSSVLPNFTCANLTLPELSQYSTVVSQYHVWDSNITASLYRTQSSVLSLSGDHIGLVSLIDDHQNIVTQFMSLTNKTGKTEALILFTPLNVSVPVPGACNMEANLQIDPNIFIKYETENVLINVTFSEANVGFKPNHQPSCTGSNPAHNRLRYDFYIYYLSWNRYSKNSLFGELQKMMTTKDIRAHGRKIHTFGKNDKPELRLGMFNGRGIIVNIIVWDSVTGTESAYVPTVTYACGDSNGSMCSGRVQPLPGVLFALGMIIGAALCFAGHRYFLAEIFFFGFLPFTLLSLMVLAANTSLSQPVLLALALVFGIPGGCIWLAVWWRFGYILPVMMWISFTLGYLVSSVIFFTPFGNLIVWYNSLAYGMAFMCGVMVIPVILIVFTKFLSMLACAVWGSYLVVAAISYYSSGVLQYILINIIHRASIPFYSEAIIVVPMNPIDYALIVVWFLLIVAGVAVQHRISKGRRDFPVCPYKEAKFLRNQRSILQEQIQYEGTPQSSRRQLDASGGASSEDTQDTAPLIVN